MSIYEKLGGAPAIQAAVEIFYRKVLSDDSISGFFDAIDMDRQMAKQRGFLTMVLGGPNEYTGKDMREGHKHLVERGLNDAHFDAVVKHLGETLAELGVGSEDIAQVAAIAESVRDEVLNR